jgi:hypothetical protein
LEKRVPIWMLQTRKARFTAGLSNRSGKEDQSMIQLLVTFAHAIFGRITIQFLWLRKRHR